MFVCTNNSAHRFNQNTSDGFCPEKGCHGKGYLVQEVTHWKCVQCETINSVHREDCENCNAERLYRQSEVEQFLYEITEIKKRAEDERLSFIVQNKVVHQKEIELNKIIKQRQTEIEKLRKENEKINKRFIDKTNDYNWLCGVTSLGVLIVFFIFVILIEIYLYS